MWVVPSGTLSQNTDARRLLQRAVKLSTKLIDGRVLLTTLTIGNLLWLDSQCCTVTVHCV